MCYEQSHRRSWTRAGLVCPRTFGSVPSKHRCFHIHHSPLATQHVCGTRRPLLLDLSGCQYLNSIWPQSPVRQPSLLHCWKRRGGWIRGWKCLPVGCLRWAVSHPARLNAAGCPRYLRPAVRFLLTLLPLENRCCWTRPLYVVMQSTTPKRMLALGLCDHLPWWTTS